MEFIERTKEDVENWVYLDSKRSSRMGFYKYKRLESKENNLEETFYKNELILEYYKVLKKPAMGSFVNIDNDDKIFESMILNNEIELNDSYLVKSISWNASEVKHNSLLNEMLKNLKTEEYELGFAFYQTTKSSFISQLKRLFNYKWGYFNIDADLEEQKTFIKNVIEQINLNCIEKNGKDMSHLDARYVLESNDAFYLSNILIELNRIGRSIPILDELKAKHYI